MIVRMQVNRLGRVDPALRKSNEKTLAKLLTGLFARDCQVNILRSIAVSLECARYCYILGPRLYILDAESTHTAPLEGSERYNGFNMPQCTLSVPKFVSRPGPAQCFPFQIWIAIRPLPQRAFTQKEICPIS